MNKELYVSSTPHETRLALAEEGEIAEVYFEREKEYSLAGSIYKGRVTRVLPGMQSAFVDIGLERDAFLYVSDFTEDAEEYDRVVSEAENAVAKLERPADYTAPASTDGVGAEGAENTAVTPAEAQPAERAPRNDRGGDRGNDRGNDRGGDRGGDRGRGRSRRRGGRGGNSIPDTKFARPDDLEPRPPAPRGQQDDQPHGDPYAAAPAPVAAVPVEALVLPGESLAKYRRGAPAPARPEAPPPQAQAAPVQTAPPPTPAAPPAPAPVLGANPTELPLSAFVLPGESLSKYRNAPPPPIKPALPPTPEVIAAKPEPVPRSVAAPVAEPEPEPESASEFAENDEATATYGEIETEADAAFVDDEIPESLDAFEAAEDGIEVAVDGDPARDAARDAADEAEDDTDADASASVRGSSEAHLQVANPDPAPSGEPREPRDGREHGRGGRGRRRRRGGRGGDDRPRTSEPGAESEPRSEPRTEPRPDSRPDSRQRAPMGKNESSRQIGDLLHEGQEILIQIAKEPIGKKGARITSHLALPGRFLVYMPTVNHIGVSRKIASDEERARLKRLILENSQDLPGGFIVRTAGASASDEEFKADIRLLANQWNDMRQQFDQVRSPALLHHDLNLVERTLRDQLSNEFTHIWVDTEDQYQRIVKFVSYFMPHLVDRVRLYTRDEPLFEHFGIQEEINKALKSKVWLKSGGYIVLNQTEALVAIDVNTGKYVGRSNRLEDTIVKTNVDAIQEIVRQIRLRDLGGIIVIDFIDMDERRNRQRVMQALEEAMRADRAPYKVLAFNDFGLVALTRKRVKQSLERTLGIACPYCTGVGLVKSPVTVCNEIYSEIKKVAPSIERDDVVLRVNPEVAKMLKLQGAQRLREMEELTRKAISVRPDPQTHQEQFEIY